MDGNRIDVSRGGRPVQQHSFAPQQTVVEKPVEKKKRRSIFKRLLNKKVWLGALIVVLVVAVGVLAYGYMDTRKELTNLAKTNSSGGDLERERLVAEIGAYMQLPDEDPTLAAVSDVSKLKGQEFFKNAQNGDRVLIFSKAERALLYRPSTHKVIEYSRISVSNTDTQTTTQP